MAQVMTLQEVWDLNHQMFVDNGAEVNFFQTWEGDLDGNITLITLTERDPNNPHRVLVVTDFMLERLGFVHEHE